MLKISLGGRDFQFYTFTEILGFIEKLPHSEQKWNVAKQALELLKASSVEFSLIEYYTEQFNSFIPKKEEHESQQAVLPVWYTGLCGFCF